MASAKKTYAAPTLTLLTAEESCGPSCSFCVEVASTMVWDNPVERTVLMQLCVKHDQKLMMMSRSDRGVFISGIRIMGGLENKARDSLCLLLDEPDAVAEDEDMMTPVRWESGVGFVKKE